MQAYRKCCLVLFILLFVAPVKAQEINFDSHYLASVDRVIVNYIRPAVGHFEQQTQALHQSMQHFCEVPSNENKIIAERAFHNTALGFARVEILRFGPLVKNNRFERLYYWPDRRGLGLKRVQRALVEKDPSLLNAKALREKSVALQGLGGLEFLLFGIGSENLTQDHYRCRLALSIAGSIAMTAADLAADWRNPDGYSALMLNPSENNPAYRKPSEAAAEIMNVLINSVEAIKLLKLNAPLGKSLEKARPKRAPFWRSQLTLPVLSANLSALSDFQRESGLLAGLQEEAAWIDQSGLFEYRNALTRLETIRQPIAQAVAVPQSRSTLSYVAIVMDNLKTLYTEEAGPALNLRAGFNSLDGD